MNVQPLSDTGWARKYYLDAHIETIKCYFWRGGRRLEEANEGKGGKEKKKKL